MQIISKFLPILGLLLIFPVQTSQWAFSGKGKVFPGNLVYMKNHELIREFLTTPEPPAPGEIQPEMPSQSHELLAKHAAESHGLSSPQKDWIAQGAYDEDHCSDSSYPPCEGTLGPFGYHSWDPDTDGYWESFIFEDGSGLSHINKLFTNAVSAYNSGNIQAAYQWLGRALHILGDQATPAHVNLDIHPLGDAYEDWLDENNRANTISWINANPSGAGWDMSFYQIPQWDDLNSDLQGQLNAASAEYGGRVSGQELWNLGPEGSDSVLFRLLFLMAEEADNWDSNDVSGEKYHGDLGDAAYLTQMRNTLFPLLVPYSAALIDYFEYIAVEEEFYFPFVAR